MARWTSLSGLLLLPLTACAPEIPEGRIACVVDDDCPGALTCRATRCYQALATQDAASFDAAMLDTGRLDTGMLDSGSPDNGMLDSGTPDNGMYDSGSPDGGMPDNGLYDNGLYDNGLYDNGMYDAGPPCTHPGGSVGGTCPTPLWMRQFGAAGDDTVSAVVASASGDVVVVGVVSGQLPDASESYGEGDVYVRRYDSVGAVAWTRQYGGSEQDHATGAGLDALGNAYVAYSSPHGSGSPSAHLLKLSPTGHELWSQTLDFNNAAVVINAIAVDPSGNVYLAGELTGTGARGSSDAIVRKYSTAGSELWTRLITTNVMGGPAQDSREYASAVAVDASGTVYVGGSAGTSFGGGSTGTGPLFLTKLTLSGSILWTRQFGPSSTSVFEDVLGALVVSADGSMLYAAGTVYGALPERTHAGGADAFVQAYRADGVRSWAHQLGVGGDDVGTGLALHTGGDLYVVGFTNGPLVPGMHSGGSDAFVRRLTHASGTPLWTRIYGTDDDDTAMAVHVSALGAVFLGGTTDGTLPMETNAGNQDGCLMRLPL